MPLHTRIALILLSLSGCGGETAAPTDAGANADLAAPMNTDLAMVGADLAMVGADLAMAPLMGFPVLPVAPVPSGRVLQVGASRMYKAPCAAIAAAMDGDTIEIDAATYAGDTCRIGANRLTLRGVGGRPVLDLNKVKPSGCKGIWVVGGNDTLIEDIEFTGAHLRPTDPFVMTGACTADKNGAALRVEGSNLTVRRCSIHDNDDGILTGAGPTSAILIERSTFRNNSFDGYSHNLYIGQIAQLTFRGNSSTRTGADGHLLKSRAKLNVIVGNRLTGEDGPDSYELNFPNGGETYVIGNVVQQGNASSNRAMLDYASEGIPMGWDNHLYVVNNTFVNRRQAGATFLQLAGAPLCTAVNNLFAGSKNSAITNLPNAVTMATNLTDDAGDPKFVDEARFDFHVQAGSPVTGVGSDPGKAAAGYSLAPMVQYVEPADLAPRPVKVKLDVGAFAAP